MSFVKYRVKEVAADFGVAPKVIAEIIGKFYEKPKSNTQVLSDAELNVVFDYMTQKNQVQSMEQIFAVKPTAPKAEQPKPEAKEAPKAPAQAQGKQPAGRPQNQNQNQNANHSRPQLGAAQAAQPAKAEKPKEPERKRERRVVDTSAVQVNSNRFADVDNLVSERVQNFQGGKQRIGGGKGKQQNKQQPGKFKGNKSRNE